MMVMNSGGLYLASSGVNNKFWMFFVTTEVELSVVWSALVQVVFPFFPTALLLLLPFLSYDMIW